MKRLALSLLLGATMQCAGATFEAREVELHAFESHQANLLNLDKPLYRLGEILQVNATNRWVVPIGYEFKGHEWCYTVKEVKVGKR